MEIAKPQPLAELGLGLAPAVVDRNRALLAEARQVTYKSAGDLALHAFIYPPKESAAATARPVAAFFFSGNWDGGLISQFAPHALYLASRGMVSILFDYRVHSRHRTSPVESMADARSAVRWIRMNAEGLQIDPHKIVGIGGAGGAHIIAAAAMLERFDDTGDDPAISCKPDALVLFNPILDTTRKGAELEKFPDKQTAKAASLLRAVRRKLPPMLLFHGTNDRVVPWLVSRTFCRKMRWRGNKCRLSTFEGEGHGFFNFNVDARLYELTMNELDAFLVERGFLEPNPENDSEPRLAAV